MPKVKQVIVWRTDLKVGKGKYGAQIGHGALGPIVSMMVRKNFSSPVIDAETGDIESVDMRSYTITVRADDPLVEWLDGSFTKIVLGCDSLDALLTMEGVANSFHIPNALIEDSGQTEFKEKCGMCCGGGTLWTAPMGPTAMGSEYECSKCEGTGRISIPTITCLAIGPDYADLIDKITGHLKPYR